MTDRPFGTLLRDWRRRRRLSQLDLGLDAGVSARHLSFLETGRAQPSRDMVLRLAEHLDIPLRERNPLLLSAGFAPAYGQRDLADREMTPVREALQQVLDAYQPFPALVVDRGWHLVAANAAVGLLTAAASPHLLEPPVNVLRLSLHPEGLAPQILNLAQWRGHLLDRLSRESAATGDPGLAALHGELMGYPGGTEHVASTELAIPLRVCLDGQELVFLSTVTTFGTALDITLAELSIESFLPADAATAQALHTSPELSRR